LDTHRQGPPVLDAEVLIYAADTQLIVLRHTGEGRYESPLRPQVGQAYTLRVSAPGFPSVEARDSIPLLPELRQPQLDTSTVLNLLDKVALLPFEVHPLDVLWKDPSKTADFYKIELIVFRTSFDAVSGQPLSETTKGYLFTEDPSAEKQFQDVDVGFVLLKDERFKGQEKLLHAFTDKISSFAYCSPHSTELELYLDFQSLSPALYAYQLSVIQQLHAAGNPLTPHINVSSNVQGGLGIFGGYTVRRFLLFEGELHGTCN